MGEIVSINEKRKSPQQRAYEWARREMNMMFPEPDCSILLLGDRAEIPVDVLRRFALEGLAAGRRTCRGEGFI